MKERPEFYTNERGCKFWYLPSKGKDYLHRLDGPAIEFASGTKYWGVDGKKHRLDGPAIERSDGTKEWWVDGKRHRTDGPAIEFASGIKQWWVDDKQLDTKEVETFLDENKIDLTTEEGQMAFRLVFS